MALKNDGGHILKMTAEEYEAYREETSIPKQIDISNFDFRGNMLDEKSPLPGRTTNHALNCGCYLVTYHASSSMELERHKRECRRKGLVRGS